MADVPDELVLGGVEDIVHGDGQLNHSQTGAQMASGLRDLMHDVGAQLLAQLAQLLHVEVLHVDGKVDGVEQRGSRTISLPCLDLLHAELVPIVDRVRGLIHSTLDRYCAMRTGNYT